MKIINLTPHTVNICDESGNILKSYPSEGNARVKTEFQDMPIIEAILETPVKMVSYSETEGLPPSDQGNTGDKRNVFYIVSMVVAQANPGRFDLLCPNTAPGEVVRDASGQIIGVKSFARY